jgi:EPS-associated MarR family transcriptional regulator
MTPLTQSGPFQDVASLGILRLLQSGPRRTQRELAQEMGMSLGKTNYVLQALMRRGLVKLQNFQRSPNKRGYAYLLTPKGVAAKSRLTRIFLAQKIEEYDALRLEIEGLRRESDAEPASPAVAEL